MSGTVYDDLFLSTPRRDQEYFDTLLPRHESPNGLDYVHVTEYSVGIEAAIQTGGAAVPEPGTMLALALGGAVFFKRFRKRKV